MCGSVPQPRAMVYAGLPEHMFDRPAVIYPELHAHSCFSFLDGASQPEELAERAAALGYETVALTDHDGLCGSLAFAHAAREAGLRAITGAEITLAGGAHLTLLVEDAAGYRNLCRLITAAHAGDRRAPVATLDQVARHADGLHCLSGCARHGVLARPVAEGRLREAEELALRLRAAVRPRPVLGRAAAPVRARRRPPQPAARRAGRAAAGADGGDRRPPRPLPPPRAPAGRARGDPVQHHPRGQRGRAARKPRGGAARRRPRRPPASAPAAVRGAVEVADRCRFDLTHDLGYSYPDFAEGGEPAGAALARICRDELERRYAGSPSLRRGPRAPGRGAAADRAPRPGRVLPAAPRHPRDGARGGGARARAAAPAGICCRPAAAAARASARSCAT